ncbi:MAG: DUF4384 domain-containing protein [Cocleimonas sp.]|nr:DUF4384 domain-containing protein [Cocleimonas sp.]
MRIIRSLFLFTIGFCGAGMLYASAFTLPPTIAIETSPNAAEETGILNTTNKLSLKLTPSKSSYRLGEKMSLTVTSNTRCYLSIVDFGTSGSANILFPNAYQKDNLLPTNRSLTIPNSQFDIKIGGKAGTEKLWAVCRLDNTPPFTPDYDFQQSIFLSVGTTVAFKARYPLPPQYDPLQEAWVGLSLLIKK